MSIGVVVFVLIPALLFGVSGFIFATNAFSFSDRLSDWYARELKRTGVPAFPGTYSPRAMRLAGLGFMGLAVLFIATAVWATVGSRG